MFPEFTNNLYLKSINSNNFDFLLDNLEKPDLQYYNAPAIDTNKFNANYKAIYEDCDYATAWWMARKIIAIPAALACGIVLTVIRSAALIFLGLWWIKQICFSNPKEYTKCLMSIQIAHLLRNLHASFGYLYSIINDKAGLRHIHKASLERSCYFNKNGNSSQSMPWNTKQQARIRQIIQCYFTCRENLQEYYSTLQPTTSKERAYRLAHIIQGSSMICTLPVNSFSAMACSLKDSFFFNISNGLSVPTSNTELAKKICDFPNAVSQNKKIEWNELFTFIKHISEKLQGNHQTEFIRAIIKTCDEKNLKDHDIQICHCMREDYDLTNFIADRINHADTVEKQKNLGIVVSLDPRFFSIFLRIISNKHIIENKVVSNTYWEKNSFNELLETLLDRNPKLINSYITHLSQMLFNRTKYSIIRNEDVKRTFTEKAIRLCWEQDENSFIEWIKIIKTNEHFSGNVGDIDNFIENENSTTPAIEEMKIIFEKIVEIKNLALLIVDKFPERAFYLYTDNDSVEQKTNPVSSIKNKLKSVEIWKSGTLEEKIIFLFWFFKRIHSFPKTIRNMIVSYVLPEKYLWGKPLGADNMTRALNHLTEKTYHKVN